MKKSVIKNLHSIVGDSNAIIEKEELKSFNIDGVLPEIVVSPSTIEQVSEIMILASKEALSVLPMGSGTKRALGNKPEKSDIILSTKNLNNILEHAASDLVATTQAGVSLKNLQSELSKENQQLALDPPHVDEGATIGGIIATNDSGPGRLRHGTAREFLIGIRVVQADGKIFKGGSKVVKNVAGYDLPKLYVGSLGTLGIIVEATFRLHPIPEYSETYLASFSSLDACHHTVMSLLGSDLVMSYLEIINSNLCNELTRRNEIDLESSKYTLAINIRNVEKAVKDQIAKVITICDQHQGKGLLITADKEQKVWNDIRNFPWQTAISDSVVCKVSSLVTDIPKLLNNIEKISNENAVNCYVSTRAGNGITIIAIEGEDPAILNTLQALSSYVSLQDGHMVVLDAPTAIKSGIDVWGNIGSGKSIMKRIKHNFDPDNLLNPGRFI